MPTRSALILLFAVLIAVPVAAAVYLGAAGLRRERAMLIEQERLAMEHRADEVRDRLVSLLQQLYRFSLGNVPEPQTPVRLPFSDHFTIDMQGRAQVDEGEVPADILELALQKYAPPANVFTLIGDLAVLRDAGGLRGFRVDAGRINRLFLDPASPQTLVRRFAERLEYARLVPEQQRQNPAPDRFGLNHLHYRHVVGAGRNPDPVLLPQGLLLELAMHPTAALAKQLGAGEETLFWTLGAVGIVVVLGLFFAWRALRAETRLATRKAEFVSAVSHELRTPLTSIRMYADMLKEGWIKDGETAQDYFGLISAESERLARLVNNVLDFSRIEKGKKGFEMRLGDPAPVVRDVAEVLGPYLREKGFDLELEVPETLPECSFDKDALTQILVNLIDNAVKYGDKEVRIEAETRNGEVTLRVLDRGPGVPPGERERIFEPFTRGNNARGGGSGLGLALVKHYAAAHHGSIVVAEREGGGAAFVLSLPAA